nr:glycosyltransferase [Deltaproteobacteria bacterium]
MLVSVCMIVRNEAAILAKAIESTKGLADEVVILDTGSTDGTVALARELGAVVLTGGDRMHKAESRNSAAAASSGEWTVILDADEQIADPVGLREHLQQTDAQALFIKLAYMDANDNPTLSYAQMRIWRRGTYQYKYRAHEVPLPTNGWGKREYTDFVWEHRPPPDRVWKSDYTLNRLLLDVEENPEDARPLYYLGRQYMYRQEWTLALETLEAYLAFSGIDEADAWHCVARCYKGLGDEKQQIKALFTACAAQPGRREWWGELAEIYHSRGQDSIAVG